MITSEFMGCVYSTLLAWNHLESLTDSHMKNDRLISPAELIVKCLAVSSWIQESYFCLDFHFNFSKGDCRTLCLERIFWALQTVLHVILIKGSNGFIPLSAALVHVWLWNRSSTLAQMGAGEESREESGCLVFPTCRVTSCHQTGCSSFWISAFTEIVTWEAQGCTFNFQWLKESHIAKPEIKIKIIQNRFEIILLRHLDERQEQAQILRNLDKTALNNGFKISEDDPSGKAEWVVSHTDIFLGSSLSQRNSSSSQHLPALQGGWRARVQLGHFSSERW